jgi:hypothetical protein
MASTVSASVTDCNRRQWGLQEGDIQGQSKGRRGDISINKRFVLLSFNNRREYQGEKTDGGEKKNNGIN